MKLFSSPIYSYVSRNRRSKVAKALVRFSNLVRRAYFNSSNHDIRTNGEALVLKRCYDACMKENGPFVFFDVGANVGDWTTVALEICQPCQAHLFEIVPETRLLLEKAHGDRRNVTINKCGLSNCSQSIKIRFYPSASTGSSEYALPWGVDHVMIDADCMRGDDYMQQSGLSRVHFLKIDVEGGDYKVLQGFERSLSEGKIDFVQFEYNKAAVLSRIFLRDFYELLEGFGYVIGPILPNGAEFKKYDLFHDESLLQSNFLAARKTYESLFNDI
ncbi:MAG: FkbM family methyltransferase [Planctomycetaceae bacterium]